MSVSSPTVGGRRIVLPRLSFGRLSLLLAVVLLVGCWYSVLGMDRQQQHPFFSTITVDRAWGFLRDLLGLTSARTPAFLQADAWRNAAGFAYDTLAMSVLAIGIAAIGALLTFMFGARNVMMGEVVPGRFFIGPAVFFAVRGLFRRRTRWRCSRSPCRAPTLASRSSA